MQFPDVAQAPCTTLVWLRPVSLYWFEVWLIVNVSPSLPLWIEPGSLPTFARLRAAAAGDLRPLFFTGPYCTCVGVYGGESAVVLQSRVPEARASSH